MKIYDFPSENNENWPREFVWLEQDWPSHRYLPNPDDRDVKEYECKAHSGTYHRTSFKRKQLMVYKQVFSLNELEEWCKTSFENNDWFQIAYRDGVMMFDPWSD